MREAIADARKPGSAGSEAKAAESAPRSDTSSSAAVMPASKPAAPPPGMAFLSALGGFAAAPRAFAGQLGLAPEAVADPVAATEADLGLEVQTLRADARAEAGRAATPLPGHAAARFTPQTVQTLAARIAARADNGSRVFDIRLDPPELGRVEVRLELGADNSVRAHLSAERPDTLAELQRYARELERALSEAGLDLDRDGLAFSLSDQDEQPGENGDDSQRAQPSGYLTTDAPSAPGSRSMEPLRLYGFDLASRRGIDVRT